MHIVSAKVLRVRRLLTHEHTHIGLIPWGKLAKVHMLKHKAVRAKDDV